MKSYKTYYKRHLPHYQPLGYTYFITFRLAGSLPLSTIQKLKMEKEAFLRQIAGLESKKEKFERYHEFQTTYFEKFDALLDNPNYGDHWFTIDSVAVIIKDAIHFYDGKAYELVCYCIMSNHVHLVITPIVGRISDSTPTVGRISDSTKENDELFIEESRNGVSSDAEEYGRNGVSTYIVTKILQDLKKFTAGKCNKALNRTGSFWQNESYDHVVRGENDLVRIINYILNNPVKAGVAETWRDWKWSYCKYMVETEFL
ncbi:MAG: hypothetical protein Q8N83_03390 [Ignavibacteria bacterium]|nr:hypothetical protein [Ignavibacteria bacterium]